VLSNRFESIIREMTNTVMKASRSSVIKNARDMSCGLLLPTDRLVSVEEALPIHGPGWSSPRSDHSSSPTSREGDAYSTTARSTAARISADLTLCIPVSATASRCSASSITGYRRAEPQPICPRVISTMEGVHFPCVRGA